VEWCTGWWLVYLCGHLDAFVRITAAFVEHSRSNMYRPNLLHIWEMVVACHELCLATAHDDEPKMAELHLRHASGIVEDNMRYAHLDETSPTNSDSFVNFVCRQVAKQRFLLVTAYRPSLIYAYEHWETHPIDSPTLAAAIAIAKSKGLSLEHKELAVRLFLWHWLQAQARSADRALFRVYPLRSVTETCVPDFEITDLNGLSPESVAGFVRSPWSVSTDDERVHEAFAAIANSGDALGRRI
jgi:hypothetical protein